MNIGLRIALALLPSLCACRSEDPYTLPPRPRNVSSAPEFDTLVRIDRQTGTMVRQWQVLRHADRRPVKHGFDRGWYPDGRPEFERAFDEGEPAGQWLSWHPDGSPRSDYEWSSEGLATRMRYWHANGTLSGEGEAVLGLREGIWTYWFESGMKREEGMYRGNGRHGEWLVYYPDGSLRSRGRYANDERVGHWQHYDDPALVPPADQ